MGTVTTLDSGMKCRAPAWTDRVLFRRDHNMNNLEEVLVLTPLSYGCSFAKEFRISDHRPVYAQFEIKRRNANAALVLEAITEEQTAFRQHRAKVGDGSVVTLAERAMHHPGCAPCVIM